MSETSHTLPVATGTSIARRLWHMLVGRRLRLIGILTLFLMEAATAVVFPMVVGNLVDTVLDNTGTGVPGVFWWQLSLLIAAALVAGAITWIATTALARLAETILAELREAFVTAALNLPRASVEHAGTGDIVTRASDDIAQASGTLPEVIPKFVVSVFTIVFIGAGMFSLNPWYLAGFALTVPAYVLALRWYLRTAPAVYTGERTAQSERGQDVLGTLNNLPTVTAHQLENRQLDRISDSTWATVRWAMRTRIVQNGLFGRLNITEGLGLIAILGIGLWLSLSGETSAGQVTAAALLFLRTIAPITALLLVTDDLQIALASLGRIIGVVDHQPPTPADPAETVAEQEQDTASDVVAVHDVHHAYQPAVPVLHGITAHIQPGEKVAVVGATGSGKSTLAALIAGIYQPSAGQITHGVAPHRVVTVTQETHVFTGTVRENLTLAAPNADDAQIVSAIQHVGAQHIIAGLDHGLDTVLGHGGHQLTAAAVQHLALARLVLTDPALVILDEATAEADSTDDDQLNDAAQAAIAGRAALVIAHRLSQAAACDRILVLDAGRIIEQGDHDSLVAAQGSYANLWAAWSQQVDDQAELEFSTPSTTST